MPEKYSTDFDPALKLPFTAQPPSLCSYVNSLQQVRQIAGWKKGILRIDV